jgi:uncharacterized protein (DUF58 family)
MTRSPRAADVFEASGLLLPPELRARLADITLRSRRPSHAGRLGQQASRSRGPGIEFAQYRSYEPGDDPRQLDWKLFARSDRYFVREAERDSPLTLWLLVDTTASMGQHDLGRPDWTRLHAARRAAACMIEIALRQGDAFGLIAIGETPQLLPPAAGLRQRDQCLRVLAGLRAAGGWPSPSRLQPLIERIGEAAQVLLLGDLFDEAAAALAERLAAARREVATLQILTADERDFPFSGAVRFEDPETGAMLDCDADSAREAFVQRFEAARRALQKRLAARGIEHAEWVFDRPADEPLRALYGGGTRAR